LAFAVASLLAVSDGVITWRCLKHGGKELNPLLSQMFQLFGIGKTIVLSRIVILLLLFFFYDNHVQASLNAASLVFFSANVISIVTLVRSIVGKATGVV